jgi:hypothetical protein
MLDREQARVVAREYLDDRRWKFEVVILDEHTREEEFGWVFFYQSADFVRTGELRDSLGGNAPLVVLWESGELHVTGTAHPIDEYLTHFRRQP